MTQPMGTDSDQQAGPQFPGSAYPFVVQRAGAAGKELYDECLKVLIDQGFSQNEADLMVMLDWDELWRALQGGKTDDELAEEMGQVAELERESAEDSQE